MIFLCWLRLFQIIYIYMFSLYLWSFIRFCGCLMFTLKGLNLTTTPVGILMEDTRLREESNNLFRQKLNEMLQWYRTNNL